MSTFFVTGTDTDVGKTYVSRLLLEYVRAQGLRTLGLKPIAAGCELATNHQLVNQDALELISASSVQLDYQWHNPVALQPAIAPHIAANEIGLKLDHRLLDDWWVELKQQPAVQHAQFTLIEGAGGWLLPLNARQLLSQWVAQQKLTVILVVGMKLGCLNHTLLTAEALKQQGVNLVGWVANQVDPKMQNYAENLAYLRQQLAAPLLGEVKHQQKSAEFSLSAVL